MFAFVYAYLLPLGLIFTFFGIICTYWTEKYLLLRRQSKPPPTGSAMVEAMVEFYVELILIIFSVIPQINNRLDAVCGRQLFLKNYIH